MSANDDTVESWLTGVTAMSDGAREFLNGEDKRPRVHMGGTFMYGVEEGVLDGRHSNWRAELGAVRRRLVEVKRFVDPERHALTQLVMQRLEWAEPRSMESRQFRCSTVWAPVVKV